MTGNGASGAITLGRKELVAKLAAIGNRLAKHHSRKGEEGSPITVQRIASYITECDREFDLTNDEQMLFLKFIVSGIESAEELLKGEC
jgi:hypothetical protein